MPCSQLNACAFYMHHCRDYTLMKTLVATYCLTADSAERCARWYWRRTRGEAPPDNLGPDDLRPDAPHIAQSIS